MSITVGDNFSYQGGKPLDARFQFSSVANMKAFAEASLYDGCLAYIPSSKKYYTYDSSNTVDTTTGRWRELETGGGGGTSDYTDLTNKPQIASVTLTGNKALSAFGLTSSVETQSSGGTTKSYVDTGEKYNWNTGSTWYGTCSTSASTTAKSVTLARGTLNFTAGAKIAVKFTYTNTASAPTLTVNSTTKNIKYIDADGNVSTPLIWWNAGDVVEFTYDGTQWLMQPTMQMLFSGQGTKIPREQIYSTTEKVVGCWTDGKPVYQKTITSTLPTPTSDGVDATGSVSIGASISTLVSLSLMAKKSEGTTIYVNETAILDANGRYVRVYGFTNAGGSDANKVAIINNKASWGGVTCYITVQYTKTTDSANSFNYGDPNEYSTTEKIVGSWIDGKPLYQKTVNTGALPNNTQKTVSHGLTGTYRIVSIEGIALNTTNGIYTPMVRSNGANNFAEAIVEGSNIIIETTFNGTSFTNSYVTLKYTKS